jgi:hypothetical protein
VYHLKYLQFWLNLTEYVYNPYGRVKGQKVSNAKAAAIEIIYNCCKDKKRPEYQKINQYK